MGREYLELEPTARYAGNYILPQGTTASEALLLERILQMQVMMEKMLDRQKRLFDVLMHEHGLSSEAVAYIMDGCIFERELGR